MLHVRSPTRSLALCEKLKEYNVSGDSNTGDEPGLAKKQRVEAGNTRKWSGAVLYKIKFHTRAGKSHDHLLLQ